MTTAATTRTVEGFAVLLTHDAEGNHLAPPIELAFMLDEKRAADLTAEYRDRYPDGWARYENATRTL